MNSHHNQLQENSTTYEKIFQFISKNQIIKPFVSSIKLEDAKILMAITVGDSQAKIFADSNCYLYLLYLIQNKKISFNQGITVYLYLLCLMQFTNKQKIKR